MVGRRHPHVRVVAGNPIDQCGVCRRTWNYGNGTGICLAKCAVSVDKGQSRGLLYAAVTRNAVRIKDGSDLLTKADDIQLFRVRLKKNERSLNCSQKYNVD